MTKDELRRLREKQKWSQQDLASMLNEALDRKYQSSTISMWELGQRKIPEYVSAFLDALALDANLPPRDLSPEAPDPLRARGEDTSPPDPNAPDSQVPLHGPNVYARVCTELWEMVAMGVGMVGAAVGSDALMRDGAIIDADKQALGRAYGKLAETNETFRRMLTGMTSGGAWLEVGLVTGTTVGKLWRNHAPPAARTAENGHVPASHPADAAA